MVIESRDHQDIWGTVGVSENIIDDVERAVLEQFQMPRGDNQEPQNPQSQNITLASMSKKHPKYRVGWREALGYVTRPEAVHEMHQLRDRYLAVSLFGFPVKIITNILRGDFEKIGTAFGKWSLLSTGFAAVANTFAPSFGAVALKEVVSVGNISLKHECESAGIHLQQAISKIGHAAPDMKNRLISSLGINPLLANKAVIENLALSVGNDAAMMPRRAGSKMPIERESSPMKNKTNSGK